MIGRRQSPCTSLARAAQGCALTTRIVTAASESVRRLGAHIVAAAALGAAVACAIPAAIAALGVSRTADPRHDAAHAWCSRPADRVAAGKWTASRGTGAVDRRRRRDLDHVRRHRHWPAFRPRHRARGVSRRCGYRQPSTSFRASPAPGAVRLRCWIAGRRSRPLRAPARDDAA